jgi:ketosteroid isomerase-like protein
MILRLGGVRVARPVAAFPVGETPVLFSQRGPMTRALGLAAVVILCAVLSACQPDAGGLAEQDKVAIRSVDEPVRQAMLSAKPDWPALVEQLYAPDIELLPPDGPTVKGLDAARAFYSGWTPVTDFKVTEDRLEGTGRFAFRRTSYAVTVAPPGAPEPLTVRGKDIVVLRKEADGKWKTIAEIWNDDAPPSGITVPTGQMAADAGPETKKMADIVGEWELTGTVQPDPKAPASPATMTVACNWFVSGRHVFCRWSGTLAGVRVEEVYPYVYDAKRKTYTTSSIVSNGTTEFGTVTIQPGTWIHLFEREGGGPPAKERFTFANMTPEGGTWKAETSVAGGPWKVIGEGKYVKAK